MNVTAYDDSYQKRKDPWGRDYFWLTGGPPPCVPEHETDLSALAKGMIALTPLDYDLTRRSLLREMEGWRFHLDETEEAEPIPGEEHLATKQK